MKKHSYFRSKPNGKLGPATRQALKEFQKAGAPNAPSATDQEVFRALFAPDAPKYKRPAETVPVALQGEWSQDPCNVASERPSVVFDANAASVYGGICKFTEFLGQVGDWKTKAVCTDPEGQSRNSDISFSLKGNILLWAGSRGSIRYYKCR